MKKGFTLIELLAVIVILAIIALIATPIVLSIIEETKESAVLRSAEHYLSTVELGVAKKNLTAGGSFSPNTCEIQDDGNLLCDGKDTLEVELSGEVPKSGTITFNKGKITDIDLTLSNKRLVKNDKGEVIPFPCTLISGNKTTPGSKYECEVKTGAKYNFYVLSTEEDGTTNLIMDRNINSDGTPTTKAIKESEKAENGGIYNLVAWISKADYNDDANYGPSGNSDKGPITAMNFLYNATKDWTNIPNLNLIYNDEGGNFVNFKITGKTRMPYLKEIEDAGCLYDEFSSCPLYLVEYMHLIDDNDYGSKNSIIGIEGYYSLSTAYMPFDIGSVFYYGAWFHAGPDDTTMGVRPVINVKL